MKIVSNIIYGIVHWCLLRKDKGYREHRKTYNHTERCLGILGIIFSFKQSKFQYCNFFGLERFYVAYNEPRKVHMILTALTIFNLILTLAPIVFVDIYALLKYSWGD